MLKLDQTLFGRGRFVGCEQNVVAAPGCGLQDLASRFRHPNIGAVFYGAHADSVVGLVLKLQRYFDDV